MHDEEDISGYLAGLLSGAPEEPEEVFQPAMYPMTVRVHMSLAAQLFVMAEGSDKSRTEMARLLIQAGIDSVLARLPSPVRDDLQEAAHERFLELTQEG